MLWLVACDDDDTVPLHFDGPIAAAILPEGEGGPFETPAGFVANSRSGSIVPLDLKEERLLNDDPQGSFLRASALPTGRDRMLIDVGVHAADGLVTLWAADAAYEQVLRVPYVVSVDEDGPVEAVPTATEPVFVDADGSGDAPSLSGLTVRPGFSATEDWSVEYDGAAWWVRGTRSGVMIKQPEPGTEYQSDNGELSFTLDGSATVGDRFDFTVDSGVREWDFGGMPTRLVVRDGRVYSLILSDPPRLAVQDADDGGWLGAVELPAGSEPWSLAFADDGRAWIGDAQQALVYALTLGEDLDAEVPEAITVAGPVQDLAWQAGEGADGAWFERLFVAVAGTGRIDLLDLETGTWVDPNPITAEVEGIDLGSPIEAIAPSVGSVWLLQETEWGAFPRVPTLVVTTQDGYTTQLDASTGCYVVDERGPHGPYTDDYYDETYYWASLDDKGADSDTELYIDWVSEYWGEQVVTSECGGVTRSEEWTLTYDASIAAWRVEGSASGEQTALAHEDQRYLSDTGAISFLLLSGTAPSTDGDSFSFLTDRGLASVLGTDRDDSGDIGTGDHVWEFPARPAPFSYVTGPEGGGWDEVDRREFALIPALNSDLVGKLQADKGKATFDWE